MSMNRRFFDNLLADRRMSLRALAREMGMKHSQLSLTLSGARRLQLDEAVKLSDIFGVPLQVVAANAGAAAQFQEGARISVAGAMRGSGVVEPLPAGVVERVMVLPGFTYPDMSAVQARTADTPLAWMDGMVFVCRPMVSEIEGLGRLCLLTLDSGLEVVATPRRGYRPNTYNLAGPYAAENAVVKTGKVVHVTIH